MQFFNKTKKIPDKEIPPPTPEEIRHQLDTARPAERRHDSFSLTGAGATEAEYPHLTMHEYRDGVWVCCCGHENPLVHYKGAYPFKKLTCGQCDKVLCEKCETTDIVTPLQDAQNATATAAKQEKSQLRLFQVCPDCGLSTRAQIREPDHRGERLCWVPVASHSHSEMCSCGASAKSDWLKFVISDSSTFRLNPQKAIYECKEAWMQKKSQSTAPGYPLKRTASAQKAPESRWEQPGYRSVQALKTPQDARESTKNCPPTHTLPDSRQAAALKPSAPNNTRSVQNTPVPFPVRTATEPISVPPTRRRPAYLTLVQNESSLKRSGAVRGKCTPRPGFNCSPKSGSYPETPVTARPRVPVRAGTWATATEHQRAHEEAEAAAQHTPSSYFDTTAPYTGVAQPTRFVEPIEEADSYPQIDMNPTSTIARKPSTMTMHAPQPMRRVATDGPLLRHTSIVGDVRLSSHGMVGDEADWSDTRQSMGKLKLTGDTKTHKEIRETDDPLKTLKLFYKMEDRLL